MPEFVYLIHPFRHGFFEDPTSEEDAIMEKHFQYLKEASEAGRVLLAGVCLDETFGMVILRLENEAAANAFMFNDPSVKQNLAAAELHPMRISLVSQSILEKG